MERILETVTLPDGSPLDICQRIDEVQSRDVTIELVPGLKLIRLNGRMVTSHEARAILQRAGRSDVIDRHRIPA